jgi:hypothetical protein
MVQSAQDLILILRNVTGRVDASDPQFTDQIMLRYLTDFIQLSGTQDIRITQNKTWWEFTLTENDVLPYPVVLQDLVLVNGAIGASTIGPLCYADGFPVFWFQDPQDFYRLFPETQPYTPSRPTYVLYYNNTLTFKNPPNKDYLIKINADQVNFAIGQNISTDYMYRYVAYGAALDIFSDFGEMDKWRDIFPAYQRYRALVYGRTNCQYQNQRPNPEF